MTQNSDRRIFLGLKRPPLVSAVDWLIDSYLADQSGSNRLDLSKLIIVTPTQRSQLRLLQMLVAASEAKDATFTPPLITTLGQFPEHLYVAEKALATDLAQQIAWSMALEETPEEEIKCLTGRHEVDDLQDWQSLAAMISKLHSRLANDIWSFKSVAREVRNETGFLQEEAVRWDVLNSIQQRYYTILHQVDLWDKQAARNYAAAGLLKADEIRCATDKHIVMLGTADLNRSVSEMLRQITAKNSEQVTILVAAPNSLADRFDEFGSLITQEWLDVPVEIPDANILIVDQPADQAYAVAHYISGRDKEFSADQITIGVPDDDLVPQLERSLNSIQMSHRHLAGRPLAETAPVRMMVACREYLHTFSYEALASLVRHPDMFRWLSAKIDSESWLTDLADFQRNRLPGFIGLGGKFPFGDPQRLVDDYSPTDEKAQKRSERRAFAAERLNLVHQHLSELLSPLDAETEQPIANWAQPWSQILVEIYGDRLLDKNDPHDQQIIVACDAIYTALGDQRQVPEKFGTTTSAIQALDWALEAATEHRVVPPPEPDAIELAGWLDLALDDAPMMAVTGMNDENVPAAEIGHQFLPNELCKKLEILDNDRRFARDSYSLTVITSVRNDYLLIAGRRDDQGEPLKPSRLLFSDDDQTAARRAMAFFGYAGKPDSRFWLSDEANCQPTQKFEVPQPLDPSPINNISVTKFREYIKCPYRFYLQHVLRLDRPDDGWRELDGGKFGDLAHGVLESFGHSDRRDSTNSVEIYEFLSDQLDACSTTLFGESHLPALRIQVEQLRLRLEQFAEKQAAHRRGGWQIVSTEELLQHDFEVDGKPFRIRGKIDRVDQHETSGQVAVWDYKSSDKGDSPEVVHYAKRKQEWKDLQLPLYRHLVKEVGAVRGADFSNVITGFILLPKKLDDVGFYAASWNAEQLQSADDAARQIIRNLRNAVFWPPNPQPPQYSEELAAICQDHVFEKALVEEVPPW